MKAKKPFLLFPLTLALLALALLLPSVASAGQIDFYIPTAYGSGDSSAPQPYNERIINGGPGIVPGYGRLPSAQADDRVFLRCGWAGFRLGYVKTAPNYVLFSMEVWREPAGAHTGDPFLAITVDEAKAYWGEVELVENPGEPFNPNIKAKAYVRYWNVPLIPLEAGDYTVHFTHDFKHSNTDLGGYPEFFPDGQHKPYMILPGSGGESWFWFTVED